jgi:hypothetical protein
MIELASQRSKNGTAMLKGMGTRFILTGYFAVLNVQHIERNCNRTKQTENAQLCTRNVRRIWYIFA